VEFIFNGISPFFISIQSFLSLRRHSSHCVQIQTLLFSLVFCLIFGTYLYTSCLLFCWSEGALFFFFGTLTLAVIDFRTFLLYLHDLIDCNRFLRQLYIPHSSLYDDRYPNADLTFVVSPHRSTFLVS